MVSVMIFFCLVNTCLLVSIVKKMTYCRRFYESSKCVVVFGSGGGGVFLGIRMRRSSCPSSSCLEKSHVFKPLCNTKLEPYCKVTESAATTYIINFALIVMEKMRHWFMRCNG